jgi:biopolymer transport protein ExbB
MQPLALVVAGTSPLGPLITILGAIKTFGAVGGESLDPSPKAQILVEDTAGAASWTASGIALWAASAVALAWLMRQRRDPAS